MSLPTWSWNTARSPRDAARYVDRLSRRWIGHGHNKKWAVFLEIEDTVIQDSESMTRYTDRDLTHERTTNSPRTAKCHHERARTVGLRLV